MKRIAHLHRYASDDFGTFGLLRTPLGFKALTIECPWRNNAFNISCIPNGDYRVNWVWSPRFQCEMYLLLGTGPRSGIRLHPGNLAGDTSKGLISHFEGCIGLGQELSVLENQRACMSSAPALLAFEDHMERQPFDLVIN